VIDPSLVAGAVDQLSKYINDLRVGQVGASDHLLNDDKSVGLLLVLDVGLRLLGLILLLEDCCSRSRFGPGLCGRLALTLDGWGDGV
jgi:hypothetical protein